MMTRRFILAASILTLAPVFHAKPDDAPGGGGGTLEERFTAAQNRVTELTGSISTLTAERDTARSELATLKTTHSQLENQFGELTKTANQAKADLTAAQSQITTLTADRDAQKSRADSAETNVGRLESLCGVKGIDPKSAVPATTQPAPQATVDDYTRRLEAANTPQERDAVLKEFSAKAREGKIKGG